MQHIIVLINSFCIAAQVEKEYQYNVSSSYTLQNLVNCLLNDLIPQ